MKVKGFEDEKSAEEYWKSIGWFWTCAMVMRHDDGNYYCKYAYKPFLSLPWGWVTGSVYNDDLLTCMVENAMQGHVVHPAVKPGLRLHLSFIPGGIVRVNT